MQLYYAPDIQEFLKLPDEEAKHCFQVMRHKQGDLIFVVDGKGNLFECEIVDDNPKKNKLLICKKVTDFDGDRQEVHLVISPTKNIDRMEWMVEKCVEIGVSEISFIITQNAERREIKVDRLYKKAISAMKQSKRATLPIINEIKPFKKCYKSI